MIYRIVYSIYFEREPFENHITCEQWHDAVAVINGVRIVTAESSAPHDWLGYYVNPLATSGQFHDRPERVHDAEVYFTESQSWLRAFYWHNAVGGFVGGVVTFSSRETGDVDFWESDPVHLASIALAQTLEAKLVGEDETNYEA